MRIVEKTCIILFISGLLLKKMGVAGGAALVTLAALICALVYLLFGFAFFNGIRLRNIFSRAAYAGITTGKILFGILAGWIFFSVVFGILFGVQNWPASRIMIFLAFVQCALLMIASLAGYVSRKSLHNYIILTRAIPFLLIVIFLYVIPADALNRLLH